MLSADRRSPVTRARSRRRWRPLPARTIPSPSCWSGWPARGVSASGHRSRHEDHAKDLPRRSPMTLRRMRRRDFLGSVGASVALSFFMPFFNRRAEADGGFPTRLLLVFTGNGTLDSEFFPSGGESDFTFKLGSITELLAFYCSSLVFPRNLRR